MTLSADNNNSDAQYLLGKIYIQNKYIFQDTKKSIYYLTLSANSNNSKAQYLLVEYYLNYDYHPIDLEK